MPLKVRGRPQAVVAVLAFAGIVVALMQTMMVPLMPSARRTVEVPARPRPAGRAGPPGEDE